MAIIVERINRSGQVLQTEVHDKPEITLGRGFDCDIILSDPHVDRYHARIEMNPETGAFRCLDQNSRNGVWLLHNGPLAGALRKKNRIRRSPFYSGQTFALGRTLLRIYASDHQVAPAEPMSRWEEIGHSLSHWWLSLFLTLVLMGLLVWDGFLNDPRADSLPEHGLQALYLVLGAVLFAGVWAGIGRSSRHDGKFALQLNIALFGLVLFSVAESLLPFLVFNLNMWSMSAWLSALFPAVILFLVLYFALIYSTHLGMVARMAVATSIPAVALVIPLLVESAKKVDFDSVPNYNRALVSPKWQYRQPVSLDQFLEDAGGLHNKDDTPVPGQGNL